MIPGMSEYPSNFARAQDGGQINPHTVGKQELCQFRVPMRIKPGNAGPEKIQYLKLKILANRGQRNLG
jgi:hypothetical protein